MVIKQVNKNSPVPRYYQVYSTLLEMIESGEIPPGDALPPTNVLTRRFGVSRITLTKAMDMLEAEGAIKRHQGKGTFACDSLPSATGVIAILNDLNPDSRRFERLFLWQGIVDGVQRISSEHGFTLNLVGPETYPQENDDPGSETLMNHINGLIFHPAAHVHEGRIAFLETLIAQDFPVVLVDRYFEELQTDRALFNDEEVGFALTQALIDRGHKQIAFALTIEPDASSVRNRLAGYRQALERTGIPYDDALILNLYSQESTETHPLLLRQIETLRFSAVLTANDPTTERLVFDLVRLNHDRLKEMTLRAGSGLLINDSGLKEIALEIAMIGDVISPHYRQFVSIIAQHSGHRLGEAAAKLLMARIKGENTEPPETVIVPMEIVELK